MFLHIINVNYIEDYKIAVSFNDGRSGTADMRDALNGPVFKDLRKLSVFSQLRLDPLLATIVWPNGADFAPEFIYFKAFQNSPELQKKFKEWGYIA